MNVLKSTESIVHFKMVNFMVRELYLRKRTRKYCKPIDREEVSVHLRRLVFNGLSKAEGSSHLM